MSFTGCCFELTRSAEFSCLQCASVQRSSAPGQPQVHFMRLLSIKSALRARFSSGLLGGVFEFSFTFTDVWHHGKNGQEKQMLWSHVHAACLMCLLCMHQNGLMAGNFQRRLTGLVVRSSGSALGESVFFFPFHDNHTEAC